MTKYRDQGYLPQAMMNFLALLGWALDDKTEIFSKEELIRHFSIERISKTAAIFNKDKLDWMNGVYIRKMTTDVTIEAEPARADAEAYPGVMTTNLTEQLLPFLERDLPEEVKRPISAEYVQQIAPLIQERLTRFGEAADLFDFFFVDELDHDVALLLEKGMSREKATMALQTSKERLESCSFDALSLEGVLRPLAAELGLKTGELFGLLRVAVTGRTAAPPLFQTMAVLGRERCLRRIEAALGKLGLV